MLTVLESKVVDQTCVEFLKDNINFSDCIGLRGAKIIYKDPEKLAPISFEFTWEEFKSFVGGYYSNVHFDDKTLKFIEDLVYRSFSVNNSYLVLFCESDDFDMPIQI